MTLHRRFSLQVKLNDTQLPWESFIQYPLPNQEELYLFYAWIHLAQSLAPNMFPMDNSWMIEWMNKSSSFNIRIYSKSEK